ncbi:MAG: prolipoprotein diacylglyceryl transferase family protein [bacterium]
MIETFIVVMMAFCLLALFAWSFHHLPAEKWQILATFPTHRDEKGTWRGVNLTYYGFFNALGVAAAVAVTIFLAGTAGLPLTHLIAVIVAILTVCIPASKIINRMVEGHWHGFTIGGASFAGMVVGPWLAWGIAHLGQNAGGGSQATLFVLAAIATAYALGEGIGRLACISFGCCYGRPLAKAPAWLQTLFSHWAFVFEGPLKKSSYAHGFDGQRLIPVQALTAIISSAAGLMGVALFLAGRPMLAYVLPILITQLWRFVSEFLRADYRGAGRISAYQWMALGGVVYTATFSLLWPHTPRPVLDVTHGLALLWTPGAILLIEALAVIVFVRMGISTVTSARITFDLRRQKP